MSFKYMDLVKFMTTVSLGFIAGFGLMKFYQNNSSLQSHSWASKSPEKFQPIALGKQKMLTSVKIVSADRKIASADDEVTLTGYVTLNEELDRPLFWEWNLPEGVRLSEGEYKGFEMHPQAGRTYTSTIKVRGFSHEQRQVIALTGYADFEDSRTGNSSTISSNPEASFEYIAPTLKAEVESEKKPGRR